MSFKSGFRKFLKSLSRKSPSQAFHKKRAFFVIVAIFICFFAIFIRAFFLCFPSFYASSLKNIAAQQYQSVLKLSPYRGTIYDHRYTPLAVSIQSSSLAVNPKIFNPDRAQVTKISQLLNIPAAKIIEISQRQNYFSWLKRKIPFEIYEQIKSMNITGLHQLVEPNRFYPQGPKAAALIGSVGLDNTGLFGIEQRYEKDLNGEPSTILRYKDARGNFIFMNSSSAAPEASGHHIVLTIDSVIQEITEEALSKGAKKADAKKAFAIVSDPHTGRILAMANYPSFDPNQPQNIDLNNTANLGISYLFEPGSVMKPFLVSSALDANLTIEHEVHNCENGKYQIDEHSILRDDHKLEKATTAEALIFSSNICTFKIAQKLGKQGLYETLHTFGFASPQTHLNLPGETGGRIDPWAYWKPIRFANIAIGQGLLVNALEVVQGFAVFANGGNLLKPYIIERIESSGGETIFRATQETKRKVISSQTAQMMRRILKRVVTEGTGSLAATKLFTSAGKTGTAEKIDPDTKKYANNKRIASFAGFTPVADPHLVIYVVVDEPQKKPYYGGTWAAPIFSEIAELSLKYLNVAPDQDSIQMSLKPDTIPPKTIENKSHENQFKSL